jgi:hypothetical protein
MPWKSEGMEQFNQLATWRGASGLTVEWRTEIRDWIQK